jgi:hypothetical protein
VEHEATNFVSSFTSIAISSAAGKHPEGGDHVDEDGASALENRAPDPTNMAMSAADAKDKSSGGQPNAVHDKAKEEMSAVMWSKTKPVMHAIAHISDGWRDSAMLYQQRPLSPKKRLVSNLQQSWLRLSSFPFHQLLHVHEDELTIR